MIAAALYLEDQRIKTRNQCIFFHCVFVVYVCMYVCIYLFNFDFFMLYHIRVCVCVFLRALTRACAQFCPSLGNYLIRSTY
jgi:hypothetical protein